MNNLSISLLNKLKIMVKNQFVRCKKFSRFL